MHLSMCVFVWKHLCVFCVPLQSFKVKVSGLLDASLWTVYACLCVCNTRKKAELYIFLQKMLFELSHAHVARMMLCYCCGVLSCLLVHCYRVASRWSNVHCVYDISLSRYENKHWYLQCKSFSENIHFCCTKGFGQKLESTANTFHIE